MCRYVTAYYIYCSGMQVTLILTKDGAIVTFLD